MLKNRIIQSDMLSLRYTDKKIKICYLKGSIFMPKNVKFKVSN
ncbi:protein of unknown function [Clostridium beijerinckii]|nr:protein of unknown function [Clostridium beijerinckii]